MTKIVHVPLTFSQRLNGKVRDGVNHASRIVGGVGRTVRAPRPANYKRP